MPGPRLARLLIGRLPSGLPTGLLVRLFVGVVVGLLGGFLASGCREAPTPRKPVVLWQPIGNWTGRASLQTESFIGNSGMFRLDWESRPVTPGNPGSLRVTLHSAVSGRPLVEVLEHSGPGRDVTYVNEDPREFYLEVASSGVQWTLTILEGVRATVPAP